MRKKYIFRYKKSVARFQDIVFTSGKISEFTTKDVMILSRALSENMKDYK